MSLRIENLISRLLENSQTITIDDFEIGSISPELFESELQDQGITQVDKFLVESMVQSETLRSTSRKQPLWIAILRFPAKLIAIPFKFLRSLFSN